MEASRNCFVCSTIDLGHETIVFEYNLEFNLNSCRYNESSITYQCLFISARDFKKYSRKMTQTDIRENLHCPFTIAHYEAPKHWMKFML